MLLKDAKINDLRVKAKELGIVAKGTKEELIKAIATKKRNNAINELRYLYHIYMTSGEHKSNIALSKALNLIKAYGLITHIKHFN